MMFRIGLPLTILLAGQTPANEPSLRDAVAEMNRGRILESIAQFKQLTRIDPTNGAAYFYLSTLYTQMNELQLAERYLQRAMTVSSKRGAYYYQLGLIRFRQKQWRAALTLFKQALELGIGNDESVVWRSIGDVEIELFDRDAALEAYQTSLRLGPKDAVTRVALGRFYLERSEPQTAIEHLRAALDLDPSLRSVYPILGRAYRQYGDLPSAVAILKQGLEADPADQESRYALAQALLAMERTGEGRAELEKYEKIRQQVAAANDDYETGMSLLKDGRVTEAEKYLRQAVRLAPTYGPALQALGRLLLDRGSTQQATGILKRAVDTNPLNAESWFSLATAYFKSGKHADALAAARWATVLKDDDPQYQGLLAEIEARLRR
jgi:tetratricopeptide (TPR) repeat protein